MKRLKERFVKVFKAEFLVGKDSLRNWITILLVLLLGIIMIYSGHLIDQKVYAIAKLETEVKELRSEFVDVRSRLQQVKLESSILGALKDTGLKQSPTPPNKIKVIVKDE
ncbi:FtsL-like putative cell division protein [Capnocytophaga granulosa]|jgi:secreted protein|uniref:FtsL-like putative cell division protein n=1 Tax=Capnocytophaga granulosa TaxID=45242 RepID=UPI003857E5B4